MSLVDDGKIANGVRKQTFVSLPCHILAKDLNDVGNPTRTRTITRNTGVGVHRHRIQQVKT